MQSRTTHFLCGVALEYHPEDGGYYTAKGPVIDQTSGQAVTGDIEVTQVAADERLLYHDMYAVWEKVYTVTVKKVVESPFAADKTNEYRFTATIDDVDTDFTLADNGEKTFENLPETTGFKINETTPEGMVVTIEAIYINADGQKVTIENFTGALDSLSGDTTITYTNSVQTTTATATKVWLNADETTDAPDGASVTFTLYADGVKTDTTVELNGTKDEDEVETGKTWVIPESGAYESESWVATFSNLPKYKLVDGETVEIVYTIFEEDSGKWTGYDRVNTESVESGGTITNKQSAFWVQFKKTDTAGDTDGHRLSGAVFTFNDGTNDFTVTSGTDGILATAASETEASANKFQFAVRTDPYVLTETTAPAGYIKLTDVVNVTVSADGVVAKSGKTGPQYTVTGTGTEDDPYVVAITNTPGTELPETGGIGTDVFAAIGGVMALFAGAVLVLRRKRKANEA